jgi:hypothetical protein
MTGRLLALCGWLAWQVSRPFRGRIGRAPALVAAALLVAVAAAPIVVPLLDPQPEDTTVEAVADRAVTEANGWVRLQAHVVVPLADAPSDAPGTYGLLVDESDELDALVIRSGSALHTAGPVALTGHVVDAAVSVEEDLPIEATVAGTPPIIVGDRLLELDPAPKPARSVLWPLSLLPLVLAAMLVIGARIGYPVFRPASEIDVLVGPLGPGERLPAAYGGRIGPNLRDLAEPGGALLLVRRGPKGNLLTAQPLADDGGVAPAPVTIGGSWTSGRLGYVYTVSETVAALVVRSELVDATFLFARRAERDRVAALIAVER